MGYYSTIEILINLDCDSITKEELYFVLDEHDREYLDDYYCDLSVDNGYITLSDYYRKNYEYQEWISILRKWYKAYADPDTDTWYIRFIDEEGGYGYKIVNNEVYIVELEWKERNLIKG